MPALGIPKTTPFTLVIEASIFWGCAFIIGEFSNFFYFTGVIRESVAHHEDFCLVTVRMG